MLFAAAEADGTRRTITFLITCLLGIALLLTGLTVWYWLATRPDRRDPKDDPKDEKADDESASAEDDASFEDATSADADEPIIDMADVADGADLGADTAAPEPVAIGAAVTEVADLSDLGQADDGLVADSDDGGAGFTNDAWDALQRSVFSKFDK